jgi:hypothetical protein
MDLGETQEKIISKITLHMGICNSRIKVTEQIFKTISRGTTVTFLQRTQSTTPSFKETMLFTFNLIVSPFMWDQGPIWPTTCHQTIS